jgi:hypothetical protein
MGNYEQVSGLTLGGRPVYRLEGNASDTARFLFFHHVCSQWAIGGALPNVSQTALSTLLSASTPCANTLLASTFCALNNVNLDASLRSSPSSPACPDQGAPWNINTKQDDWTSSYSVAVFAPTAPAVAACSEIIYVRGAEAKQLSSMGRFYVVPHMTLGGRPVYARDYYSGRSGRFLYYSPNTANWYIGSSWGSYASAVLRSTGASAAGCPDAASGWEVSETSVVSGSGTWSSSFNITVAARTGMTQAG